MGNNGSSTRDQQAASVCSNGLSVQDGASRGWSQSFPREITRHRSQPTAARKVLPEPPNQRLRATDNGNIIHNGGTISGRRAPTFASSRDLAKRTCNEPPFRERSCSASNLVQPCSRRIDRPCCRYRADDSSRSEANASSANLKKFGSEPDLRCSPELVYPSMPSRSDPAASNSIDTEETARSSFGCYRYGKETKDRLESGYRARKKYKAPAPPSSAVVSSNLHGSSSPASESRSSRDLDTRYHPHSHAPSRSHPHSHVHHHRYQVQPPPRRSRLFKTRAESKKAQISWQLSPSFDHDRERTKLSQRDDASSQWNGAPRSRTSQHSDTEVAAADSLSIDRRDRNRDRSTNVNDHRHHHGARHPQDHGKNTLQRSMSSPEFQAELIRVAKRVRDKLDSSETVLDEPTHDRRASRFDTEATISCVDRRPPSRRRNEIEDAGGESRGDSKERDRRGRYEDRSVERRPSGDPVDNSENGNRKTDGGVGRDVTAKSNQRRRTYESPALLDCSANDAVESPKPVEPRRISQQQNSDPGRRNDHWSKIVSAKRPLDQRWSDVSITGNSELRSRGNECVGETSNPVSNERSEGEQDQAFASMTPKTFYFGMNEDSIAESRNHQDQDPGGKAILESEAKLLNRDRGDGRASFIADATDDTDDNERSVVENISLKLRPTLPKKQLEIPRFSPSAAWRLLSTLETPGPSMSTASEEVPVMFEERIERLSRPPPPFPLSLGPRSWHDKSGDSGISGDAGAGNEDSFEVSTINRIKTTVTRPAWTPQQDLGEESSSDAGVDSPPPLSTPLKYHSPRAHVFSLSLPRDEARTTCLCAPETKTREASAFNSLQKLKRSVSGAFGIGSHEHQRKCTRDLLDDNWLLSTSAPTSLQHSRVRIEATRISPSAWRPFLHRDRDARRVQRRSDDDDDDNDNDDDDDDDDEHDHDHDLDHNIVDDDLPEDEDERIKRDHAKIKENDFPVIMKPPSFSYLTPGGHVMYLPEMNETKHRGQNLRGKKAGATDCTVITSCERNTAEQSGCLVEITPFRSRTSKNAKRNGNDDDNGNEERTEQVNDREEDEEEDDEEREEEAEEDDNEREDEEETKVSNVSKRRCKSSKNRVNDSRDVNQFSTCAESRENVSQPKQRRMFSPSSNDERGTANPWNSKHPSSFDATEVAKPQRKTNSRSKRFTFQSTVRQIERRRLAEKLSREVEAKERQRKGELEAMRKVEEEFQRKRAKEKANIRQQLRLFKEMEENFNSLPTTDWDGSQLSRADPDGAPSSTASSPTSLPIGNSSTITASKRDSDSTKQPRAERKGYRPKYYDWSPDTSNHLDNHRQTTVHPKVVCDIPKSSPVFVDANVHPSKPPITSNSTPKSDNYRKDFAHGTVATKTSFASSDSELSQPNTRPHSRQNGIKSKPLRPR